MIEVWTGHLGGVDPDPGAWEKYLIDHAAAVPVTDPAEQDALRREYAYLPRRRWWR
jgi:hypothetical protein